MKGDIVIINAFPNNEEKLMLLVEQLGYLTKLGKPILLISGCPVPEFIENKVQYLFINTENEIIGKDFSYFLHKNGIHDFAFDFFQNESMRADFYWSNVNCTIAKNIKLGFELAKSLGYKHAFYTEDDNIWKDGSFGYIENNLNKLKSGKFKVSGVMGNQHESVELMIFTTFFFAEVNYFCNKFTIPVNSSEWYDINNVVKYRLNKIFEDSFYHLLLDELHLFHNSEPEFLEILENEPSNRKNFAWGIYNRRNSEKNLINTFFTVLPTNTGEKHLMLNNQSFYLKTGGKTYTIEISLDGNYDSTITVDSGTYYTAKVPDNVKLVTLNIHGYGVVNINATPEAINHNGYITYQIKRESVDTIDYVVGGRMGDFFQVLYVVHQNYLQTGRKGNVYITNDLRYGGDAFTKPLEILYPELLPIMNQQEYINKFEILDGQTDRFINLNDWRLPQNLQPQNFPWIDLFNMVYLKQYGDKLTYQPWIKYSGVDLRFSNKVVIHRAHYRITEDEVNWEQLIRDNDCVFVGFDNIQYESFPYKDMLPFHKMETISEFCAILNACKFYVGNQTGPLSIAHAMDIPRMAELCNLDSVHYVGEERYFKELNWISNMHPIPILRTINNHIKYEPLYTFRQ
jgi:hypothetical protein